MVVFRIIFSAFTYYTKIIVFCVIIVDILPMPKGRGIHWLLWGKPPPHIALKQGVSAAVVTVIFDKKYCQYFNKF